MTIKYLIIINGKIMEQAIGDASAVVLKYNMQTSQWADLGSESGPSNITLLKSPSNEYRFVAWKISNHECILNSFLFSGMHYDATTPTFHQWYDDSRSAYGLNFIDSNEAKKFGIAVECALETINEIKSSKPIGDTGRLSKRTIESSAKSGSYVSPYATSSVTVSPKNNSSTIKEAAVPIIKSSAATPSPPGPPPTISNSAAPPPPPGPPPPGPAPSGPPPCPPTAHTSKVSSSIDFASQLKAASQNIKSTPSNVTGDNSSSEISTPIKATLNPPSASGGAGPMDFLSELKMRSQKRTIEGTNQVKRPEPSKCPSISIANTPNKILGNHPAKLSASTSDLSVPSTVSQTDLEKFRNDLMQDILINMEKMKNEIISSILAKLN